MSTFLLAVLGTLVGLLLVVALVWLWLKRKLARFVRDLGEAFGSAAGGVSPFRITLEPVADPEWSRSDSVDALTAALVELGYEPAGDFLVPEMEGVKLRGLVNGGACTLAGKYRSRFDYRNFGMTSRPKRCRESQMSSCFRLPACTSRIMKSTPCCSYQRIE